MAIDGADITVVVCAANAAAVAAEAAQLAGVSRVLTVENPANEHALAAVLAPQIVALAGPTPTCSARRPRLARTSWRASRACSSAPQVSDIMAVESATRFRRPIYAGNAILTVEVAAGSKVVGTVRTASFAAAAAGGPAPIEKAAVDVELPEHTRFVPSRPHAATVRTCRAPRA